MNKLMGKYGGGTTHLRFPEDELDVLLRDVKSELWKNYTPIKGVGQRYALAASDPYTQKMHNLKGIINRLDHSLGKFYKNAACMRQANTKLKVAEFRKNLHKRNYNILKSTLNMGLKDESITLIAEYRTKVAEKFPEAKAPKLRTTTQPVAVNSLQ